MVLATNLSYLNIVLDFYQRNKYDNIIFQWHNKYVSEHPSPHPARLFFFFFSIAAPVLLYGHGNKPKRMKDGIYDRPRCRVSST